MLRTLLVFTAVLTSLFFSGEVEAKRFRNSYISFELPDGWTCRAQGVTWICNHKDKLVKKEAQIVIAAKEKGPSDRLEVFTQYLKAPRTIEAHKKGQTVKTQPIHTKQKLIGNKTWIDSLHLSGESEAYYTRYLATVHKDLAIIATFTIHRNAYPYHSKGIFDAIESLSIVFNKPIVANGKQRVGGSSSGGRLGGGIGSGIGSPLAEGEDINTRKSSSNKMFQIFGALLIIGAGVFYYFLKKTK